MRPQLVSINGFDDVGGTDYTAVFVEGEFSLLPPADRDFTDVSFYEPIPGDKTQDPWEFGIRFFANGNTEAERRAQLAALKGRYRPQDAGNSYPLVVTDLDNEGMIWAVDVTPVEQSEQLNGYVLIRFSADYPYLVASVADDEVWNITASGQTLVVNNGGTMPTYPTITVSPTAVKGGGFVSRLFCQLLNPSDTLFPGDYGYDLSEVTPGTASFDTAALVKDTTKSNQINQVGGITNSATSFPIDTAVGGGLNPNGGVLMVDTEQIRYTNISAGTVSVASDGRGWGGTTAATHADDAVCYQSYMLANGNDLRVFFQGKEVDRWLSGMNTTTTKVWVNLPGLQPRIELPLKVALAAGGTTEVSLTVDTKTKAKFDRIPNSGEFMIGTDRFSYSGKNNSTYKLNNVQQGIKNTTAATHAVGATLKILQYDIVIAYGNYDIAAPTQDDTRKPAFNLSSSTNISHVYDTTFNASGLLMANGWIPSEIQDVAGLSAEFYTASHVSDPEAEADPFSAMGMKIQAYESAGKWLAGTGGIVWSLNEPMGITTMTWTGKKYRVSTKWPKVAALQKSLDGKKWSTVVNEATPASANSYTDLTAHSGVTVTSSIVRFLFQGTGSAAANDRYEYQIMSVTVNLNSANTPVVAVGAGSSIYEIDGVLTNNTNGKQLVIKFVIDFNEQLEIDIRLQNVVYLKTGEPAFYAAQPALPTHEWFRLDPGDNELQWDEVGVTGFTITLEFFKRGSP